MLADDACERPSGTLGRRRLASLREAAVLMVLRPSNQFLLHAPSLRAFPARPADVSPPRNNGRLRALGGAENLAAPRKF
jgi:hypothetical protein